MRYKAVLLYKDIPIKDWPVGVSGEFIFKIMDLPMNNQVPDKRPWRLWTPEQANQYSSELNDDFERFDERFDRMTDERKKLLALRRAEKHGEDIFRKLKIKVKDRVTKANDLIKIIKDFSDFKLFLESGFLGSSLVELAAINTQDFTDDDMLEIGNPIRQILGLEPVETQAELAEGIL